MNTATDSKRKGSIGILIALGVLAVAIIAAGTVYGFSQYNKLRNVCVRFLKTRTKINTLGAKKTDITLYFELFNKSDVTATVSGYEFNVYANAAKVSTAYSSNTIELTPRGSSFIDVSIVFNPLQVVQTALQNLGDLLASDKSGIEIEIVGKLIGIKSSIISISEIPISYKTNLKELTTPSKTNDEANC